MDQIYLSRFKSLAGFDDIHAEPAKGSAQANKTYCSKEGDVVEWGEPIKQGQRTDIAQTLQECKTIENLVQQDPALFIRYHRGIKEYYRMTQQEEYYKSIDYKSTGREPPKVYWFYGATGSGKTRTVHEIENDLRQFWSMPGDNLRWFNGYDGQQAVLFDDFRPAQIQFSYFLKLLDRYPMQVETKFGFTDWKPLRIYITTPKSIVQSYTRVHEITGVEYHREDLGQLIRRVTEEREFVVRPEPMEINEILGSE